MKKSWLKKLVALATLFALALPMSVPVFAANKEPMRVTMEVDTFEDVKAFYKSAEYDSSKRYSFILKHPIANASSLSLMRAGCPNCGGAGWTGSNYRTDERDVFIEGCPDVPTTSGDVVVVFRYTYLESCRLCGFERAHDEHFFVITCHHAHPLQADYEAWNGQSWRDGYDKHEDKTSYPWAYAKYPW